MKKIRFNSFTLHLILIFNHKLVSSFHKNICIARGITLGILAE